MLGLVRRLSRVQSRSFSKRVHAPRLLEYYGGASAAYSLRKVKSDYTGHAVRIRRGSDDVEVNVSFDTNDEVSTSSPIEDTAEQGGESGNTTATTLGEFLTEDVDITNRLIVPADVATRFVVTSSTDASNYTVSINNGSGEATFSHMRSGLFGEGHYRLRGTLTASNLVGDIKIQTNGGLPDNTQFVSITNGTNNLDFEFDITGDGSTTSAGSVKLFFFINDVASATLEVSNLTWEVTTPDAAVHTWYDQSGSSENATQTTDAQCVIVANVIRLERPSISLLRCLMLDGLVRTFGTMGTTQHHKLHPASPNCAQPHSSRERFTVVPTTTTHVPVHQRAYP